MKELPAASNPKSDAYDTNIISTLMLVHCQ